ncbi:MAG: hypothetical protein MUF81_07805 [Verrucomicrobia bacterium]|jgi:hypothetical protein|nr:hypothetical protein [Verrucomicrobiota bacterium]
MNINDPWKKLSAAARRCSRKTDGPVEIPFGLDTRVLARLRDKRPLPAELWLRLAWRLVPVGAAVFLVCWVVLPARAVPETSSPDLVEQLMQEVLSP